MFRSYSDHLQELICSLLKLLILKFVKNVKVNVVMRQHNIWCVYVLSVYIFCCYMLFLTGIGSRTLDRPAVFGSVR